MQERHLGRPLKNTTSGGLSPGRTTSTIVPGGSLRTFAAAEDHLLTTRKRVLVGFERQESCCRDATKPAMSVLFAGLVRGYVTAEGIWLRCRRITPTGFPKQQLCIRHEVHHPTAVAAYPQRHTRMPTDKKTAAAAALAAPAIAHATATAVALQQLSAAAAGAHMSERQGTRKSLTPDHYERSGASSDRKVCC
ncbi:hypothetical protein ACSSS7_004867 [Eimeria intestinalis]